MVFLKKIKFNYDDQKNFAIFSGDYNPIHLDKITSRRSFTGTIIVHGINIFLNMLELMVIKKLFFNSEYKVKFRKYVTLDKYLYIYWNEEKKELQAKSRNGEIFCIIKCIKRNFYLNNYLVKKEKNILGKIPLNLDTDNLINKETFKRIHSGKKSYSKKLFPYLSNILGENIVFEISGLSSIVGMRYPGLRSLFLALDLNFLEEKGKKKIKLANPTRFGLVKLKYEGINISSNIEACFRPKVTDAYNYVDIKKKLNFNADMSNTKVLVVGGSRGIGAVTAKILSIYNCQVTITYNKGKEEANAVKKDVKKYGKTIKLLKLDVTEKKTFQNISNIYNQVYYFPTPKILKNTSNNFDIQSYKLFHSFYVKGFEDVIKKCLSEKLLYLMYPSTAFITTKEKGFMEYIKAKQEGELICKKYEGLMDLKIHRPRIPPLLTDQTLSLIPKNYPDIVEIVNSMIIKKY